MRVNYTYTDGAGEHHHGTSEVTLEEVLSLFHRFDGNAVALYVIVDSASMIGWYKHGPLMYEVNLWNHEEKRRRFGQVPNAFAEECLRRVFEGDRTLRDLEDHSFLYSAGEWKADADQHYWIARDVSKWG